MKSALLFTTPQDYCVSLVLQFCVIGIAMAETLTMILAPEHVVLHSSEIDDWTSIWLSCTTRTQNCHSQIPLGTSCPPPPSLLKPFIHTSSDVLKILVDPKSCKQLCCRIFSYYLDVVACFVEQTVLWFLSERVRRTSL